MKVQVWLHRLDNTQATGNTQSKVARQLLTLACKHNGIAIEQRHLDLPGLELMAHFEHNHGKRLSISHCKSLVVTAISTAPLGIDCEVSGRQRNWQTIADNFFSVPEARALSLKSPQDIETSFIQHWVLKEAFIKANRGSIFGDLNTLTVSDGASHVQLDSNFSGDVPWWVWRGNTAQCHLGICANSRTRPALSFFESALPVEGDYHACDEQVLGEFIPTI